MQSDLNIDYNDEIASIEHIGEDETIDITVSHDNLFYANNILTKNSMGGPMTFDFLIALIANEELTQLGQVMIKQLKNRYADLFDHNKFMIGVDRPKMKFFDLSNPSMNTHEPPPHHTTEREEKTNKFAGVTV